MKHICINCHFFSKEYREPDTGRALSFSVSKVERNKAKKANVDFVDNKYCLKCHMGVWDEGLGRDIKNRINCISIINRKNKCFFFPYDPGMMFCAAKELQKREQENNQIKRSNMYTRIGLWVATLALLVNSIVGIIRLSK